VLTYSSANSDVATSHDAVAQAITMGQPKMQMGKPRSERVCRPGGPEGYKMIGCGEPWLPAIVIFAGW
jgi:hypothetical protein